MQKKLYFTSSSLVKGKESKSRRVQRQKSDTAMSNGKGSVQQRGSNRAAQVVAKSPGQAEINDWRRLERTLRREMRSFEKVMEKQQQRLK